MHISINIINQKKKSPTTFTLEFQKKEFFNSNPSKKENPQWPEKKKIAAKKLIEQEKSST